MNTSRNSDNLDLWPYVAVLLRHRYLILTACLAAGLTSLVLTYVFSEKYVSYSTVLYQPNESVSFRPKQREALGFPMPLVPLETIGNTLEEVAKSDGVIERVVRTLHLDVKRPRDESNWFIATFHSVKDSVKEYGGEAWQLLRYGRILPKDPFGGAMADLRKNLTIRRTTKAYTFRLEVVGNDPQLAAEIVDEVASVLAEFIRDERVRVATQTRESLEVRLKQNEGEIADLRDRIEKFKASTNVSSLSEQLSLKLKTVASFQEEYVRSRNELQGLQRKRAEIQQQLDQQEKSVKYDSTSTQNPVVEQMRLELARLEVERSGLMGRYTEEHQDVKTVDARMAQVQKKLATEQANVVSSESVRSNDIYQKLLSERLETDSNIEALTARIRAYDGSVGRESTLARELTSKEQQLGDLALQLQGAERSFALISEAYEEARIAESRAASEVSILHKAFVPRAPARPIKILHVGASILLTLILGIGLAFLFNFLDTSLRRIDQVERVLNIPVLGTIPVIGQEGFDGGALLLDRTN